MNVAGRPAAFRVEQVPAVEPRWPVGFAGLDRPDRFTAGVMLRPDTSFIYERGMGSARTVKEPGQPPDTILAQNPQAGTPLSRRDVVQVSVNRP